MATIDAPGVDEVHAWVLHFDRVATAIHPLVESLSPAERSRAGGILNDEGRTAFILVRAVLRTILSACTGVPAPDLRLHTTPAGKPVLVGSAVEFSVSHTRGSGLIALGRTSTGADVERLGRPHDPLRIARRLMHPQTIGLLERLAPAERAHVFVDAWAQREAHVKAVGGGMFRTADTLPFITARADGTFNQVTDRADGTPWSVARFAPSPSTRAAIVVRGAASRLEIRDATTLLDNGGGT
jgi:4'-phosphopantetheinyl transferase